MARRLTGCLHRGCEGIERETQLGKREEGMEQGMREEQMEEETYRCLLIHKVKPRMSIKRNARHVSRMVRPTEVWLPSAWGNTGCVSAQDPSLNQVPWASIFERPAASFLPPFKASTSIPQKFRLPIMSQVWESLIQFISVCNNV